MPATTTVSPSMTRAGPLMVGMVVVETAVACVGNHFAPPTSKNTAPKTAAMRVRRIPVTGIRLRWWAF